MIFPDPRRPGEGLKHLSVDGLHALLQSRFSKLKDGRTQRSTVSLSDACMSAFALFSLKAPSLLAFDARRNDANLKSLYRINQVFSVTQMRVILDEVNPAEMRPAFNDVFRQLQRGKASEQFAFFEGFFPLGLDGTGYFSSEKIHCASCLEKVDKKTGQVTYAH
jgi:hypothetical protein